MTPAYSWNLHDLWVNKDHIAQQMMDKADFANAFQTFERTDWKATAAYRAKQYMDASNLFATLNTADGYYNQGNALAFQGQYQQAIAAYDNALKLDANHKDAIYNRNLVEKLLKKQESKKSSDQNKSDDSKSEPKKEKQQENKQNQEQKIDQDNKKPSAPSPDKDESQPASKTPQQQEKDHAKDQWLSIIPDDPGAFLREKFLRDYLARQ